MLGLVNPYLLPSPARVAGALYRLAESGALWQHLTVSLGRVLSGFGLAVLAALPAALLFHCRPRLRALFHSPLELLRATPPLAMIPLLILWFGIGEGSKLAVIVLASFFPVFLSALSGFDSVDSRWLELSRSLELSFFRRLAAVLIPGALSQIITGLRLGFGYAWRALLGAELFASAAGLGYLITDAQNMARVDTVLAGIIVIGLLGLLFDTLLRYAALRLSPPAEETRWYAHG